MYLGLEFSQYVLCFSYILRPMEPMEPMDPIVSRKRRYACDQVKDHAQEEQAAAEKLYRQEMKGILASPALSAVDQGKQIVAEIRERQKGLEKRMALLETMRAAIVEEGEAFECLATQHRMQIDDLEELESSMRTAAYQERPLEMLRTQKPCSDPLCDSPVAFVPEGCPHGYCILHVGPYLIDPVTRQADCPLCHKTLGARSFYYLFGDQGLTNYSKRRYYTTNARAAALRRELGHFCTPTWLAGAAPPTHPLHTNLAFRLCTGCRRHFCQFHMMDAGDAVDAGMDDAEDIFREG